MNWQPAMKPSDSQPKVLGSDAGAPTLNGDPTMGRPTGLAGDLGVLHNHLRFRLGRHSDSPSLDSWVLLAYLLEKPKSWVIAHPEYRPNPREMERLGSKVRRLDRGEPLPYVLGVWEFFGLKLKLTPEVLIPRPETELLVELAQDWLRERPHRSLAADIGTGSGCIAIALAKAVPDLRLFAADISSGALKIARQNIKEHGLSERVSLLQADLLDPVHNRFDLICANLPYIPTQRLRRLEVYRYEPTTALDGGEDGLDVIHRLIESAQTYLKPGGLVLLEIEADQGRRICHAAEQNFPSAVVRLITDIAGRDRIVAIQLTDGN
jgi:release factor glutamine methyltransferase